MKLEKMFGKKLTKKQEILFYSSIAALVVILFGLILSLLFGNFNILLNFFIFAVFVFVLPFFFYKYLYFLEIKDCEKYLPMFLDDIKEAKKSGISFPEAIKTCKGDYGKLNKYIKKLKKDITWGISIDSALKQMQKSLKESRILSRSISTLLETYRSGGNMEDILETLINSLLKIMESEKDKKSTMQQHVFMMYGIFLMFVGLIIAIGNFLIPMISEIGESESGVGSIQLMHAESPCLACYDPFCYGLCGYYNIIGSMFDFGEKNSLAVYYKSLFFTMIVIQGFFTGLIVGQISAKSWLEGAKHGLIMFFLGLFIIIIANFVGIF
jgi:flagellar protein FlaJ